MTDHQQFEDKSNPPGSPGEYERLAKWLKETLPVTTLLSENVSSSSDDENEFEGLFDETYHLHFYQQLPDFVIALLKNDPLVNIRFAPLLYHLLICPDCHRAYLEIYDAMRVAVQADEIQPPVSQGLHFSVEPPPARVVVHLCKVLISQAEAVLRQAHRDHTNGDPLARSLLQQAMRISSRIAQNGVRGQALEDLVRVATLFNGAGVTDNPAAHSYSLQLTGSGGPRRGKTVRRAETFRHAGSPTEQPVIYLRDSHLEGTITQHEDSLELHLEDLDEHLRGHYVIITIPLGSLFEPVHWIGGNPHAIRSAVPVAEDGTLTTPLGETTLHMNNPEERNQLEVTFWRLEVRPA